MYQEELNERAVIFHHRDLVWNWKPKSEVWFLKRAPVVMAGAAVAGGLFLNSLIRRRLYLTSQNKLISVFCVAIPTAALSSILHLTVIQNRIYALDEECVACLGTKAALIQSLIGIAYPCGLALPVNIAIAHGSNTVMSPPIRQIRKVIQFFGKVASPLVPHMTVLFIFHTLLAGFITYKETTTFAYVREVLKYETNEYMEKEQSTETF